jgi:hypothetical protein
MTAAAATVIIHGEYARAIPPIMILTLAAVVGWMSWQRASRDYQISGIRRYRTLLWYSA